MPLATIDDIEARLGRDLTPDETTRIPALIEEASALVTSWCRNTFTTDPPTPVPSAVVIAVSRIAARALTSTAEPGVTSMAHTAGPFMVNRSYSNDSGIWLGRQDKQLLRPHRHVTVENINTGYRPPTTTT